MVNVNVIYFGHEISPTDLLGDEQSERWLWVTIMNDKAQIITMLSASPSQ